MEIFTFMVSYSQIAVFRSDLDNPSNDWTNQHVAQGFSWRDESVSFKTLVDAGPTSVEVVRASEMPIPNGSRAISVPFFCPEDSKIEIASIAGGQVTGLPGGRYQLIFETGYRDDDNWCRFTFIPHGSELPMILIADSEIIPAHELLMYADPA